MKLKTVQLTIICLYAAAIVFAVLTAVLRSPVMIVLAMAAVIAQTVVRICFWKCPHCGRILGKQLGPQHCRYCGEKVEL